MTAIFRKWVRDTNGATAIEYGLIVALITVVISAGVFTFGETLAAMFATIGRLISGEA
ncbi:MAG: Flp family type IVb pilin [Micavibrio aeruginosavorus]|uniref:Flp family type IVb pilin n=1 Tax=Micavibrio aeruginosavorus TaxID=349221 RepID=A0A2W4ZZ41_9BACT|nr:MAG: Flp family type IVb pilin [Micavibrio aeruginosavorus]